MKLIQMPLFVFALSLCMTACTSSSQLPMLNLEENISTVTAGELNPVIDSMAVIELKSGDELIKSLFVFGEDDEKLFGYSDGGDVFIFSQDGILLNKFNKTGKGPQEYLSIWCAKLDPFHKQIIILDFRNKLLKYTYSGEFVEELSGDWIKNFSDVTPIGDGNYVACLSNSANKQYRIGIFNSRGELNHLLFPVSSLQEKNTGGMIHIESAPLYNSKVTYKSNASDTLYTVSSEQASPEFVINQGSLRMPAELAVKVSRDADLDKEKARYISNLYGHLAGDYYLASYYYQGEKFYDLWNVKNGENLIHQNFNRDLYGKGAREGFKLNVKGRNLYAWPRYVQDNVLYCVVEYAYFHNSSQEADENKNPVVIKLWL